MVAILRSEVRPAREGNRAHSRPWQRNGSIDVEELAAWAYGSQMVDRFERVGLHRIEADCMGFEPNSYSADGCGMLMAIEHLGCRIDGGSARISDAVHPVAYAVAVELKEMGDLGAIVRRYAQSGTRPVTWKAPTHKVRPRVWVKEGEKAQVDYLGPGRGGAYCSIIIVWDPAREQWGREQYELWWSGLADLAWRLSSRALGFTVTGPAAPVAPWDDEKSAESSSISLDEAPGDTPPSGSSQGDLDQWGAAARRSGIFEK